MGYLLLLATLSLWLPCAALTASETRCLSS